MLQDALTWLERRCETEAPSLLEDVRRVSALATSLGWTSAPGGDSVPLDIEGGSFAADGPTEEVGTPVGSGPAGRYVDLGVIGRGGMGEVRRVRDLELRRVIAMKHLRNDLSLDASARSRFVEEVRTTAQLQHPGIVPVYDAGCTPDGRAWFTMKEVRGRTLGAMIREVHAATVEAHSPPDGWSVRRLVGALHQAAQAVAYAHERGVVHRDLKPENVMLGAHGEVQVMDWGLSKVLGRDEQAAEQVVIEGSRDATRAGRVMGTPAYMAPEQARGDLASIDARTDVYALGAMLYEVLSGRPPYLGGSGAEVVSMVLSGPPAPLARHRATTEGANDPTDELVAVCGRAMAREPDRRHPSAAALAADLEVWLDGSKRRDRALELVAEAQATVAVAQDLERRAAALDAEAAAELALVPPWAPEGEKLAAWGKQDQSVALRVQAALASLARDQRLAASLTHAPDLPEALATLAEDQLALHAQAEVVRDAPAAARAEALLRAHVRDLPEKHEVRRRAAAYLRGAGALTLVTDPDGAEVELLRYEPHGRRLVARHVRSLGRTPLVEVPLEMGSYLLLIRHPDRATVRYPVQIGRGAHWDGVRPGAKEAHPVQLPRPEQLGPDDMYVPSGWFLAGGHFEYCAIPAGTRLWCDAFVMRRFPVTNREYIGFLDDLVARGLEAEALRNAPREPAGQQGAEGALIYGRDEGGRFHLVADAEGDIWLPDWPVMMIDWSCATAFARWSADRTGEGWRLPWEFECEKAIRGVDGRTKPWGDGYDASYSNTRGSLAGRSFPAVVDSFPVDESVHGVRGLGGNVRTWCVDVWTKAGPPDLGSVVRPFEDEGALPGRADRVLRGAYFSGFGNILGGATRIELNPGFRASHVGLRLARSWSAP